MNEFVDAVLSFRFEDLLVLVRQVIDNPLANVQASLLLLIALVIGTLLAIVVAILVIGYREEPDDEELDGTDGDEFEEGEAGLEVRSAVGRAASREARRAEPQERRELTPAERRWRVATSVLFATTALAAAWLLTGVTTGVDSMCLSCHAGDMPHASRLAEDPIDDPHVSTSCVSCHEGTGWIGRVTTAVPARAAHFAEGVSAADATAGYGLPVTSGACSRCHARALTSTTTNDARGLRMSHVEPLDAGATCMDCHEMQHTTGVVGSWTDGMGPCLRCHDDDQASAACDYCHTKDIAFAVHVNYAPEPKRLVPDTRCGSCHDQTGCDECHGLRMPHSAEFIALEHPRAATLDIWYNGGQTCERCHTETRNPCTSCHRMLGPGHPIDQWPFLHGGDGPAASDGCNGCHGYLSPLRGQNFCSICHAEYAQ